MMGQGARAQRTLAQFSGAAMGVFIYLDDVDGH
jgi:hypothetical protein